MSFADKDRELGEAQAQIKALKLSERAREKAVEEVIFVICYYADFPSCFFFFACPCVYTNIGFWIF